MDMCLILKNMGRVEIHITMGFVLRDRLVMSLKLTTMKSWKMSLNYNIIASIIEYFYSNIIAMTTITEKSK